MNDGGNKTPLALMEQVIMVFVFALAAALCVQVFVYARTVSVSMEERDHGIVICQNIAETAKECKGNLETLQERMEGSREENEFVLYYDDKWNQIAKNQAVCYRAAFRVLARDEFCSKGEVLIIKSVDDTEIFSLPVAWQE